MDTKTSPPASDTATPVQHEVYNADVDTSGVDERKLVRKLDLALIPWLRHFIVFVEFSGSHKHRKLYNLEKDLHMTDDQYLISLTVFFFRRALNFLFDIALVPMIVCSSYAIFEVPSNVFLKRLRPSLWLSLLMLLWGIMMTVQGLVHNFGGLVGMRWMLGTFEAGLFPGVNYYLSCWYKRSEFGTVSVAQPTRNQDQSRYFLLGGDSLGAFGGLLAHFRRIGDRIRRRSVILDYPGLPRHCKFLTEAERTVVIRRLQSDDQFSAAGENLKWKYIWKSLLDWKTWLGMAIYVGADMPLYAFALFLPSIINQLGFKATPANLLTVPVYFFACCITCLVGFLADRYGHRGYFNMWRGIYYPYFFTKRALSYFAVYMATCGIYPVIPNSIAWVSNNVEGSYKRSVSLAMVISFGNINGAVSSNVTSHGILLATVGLVLMYIMFGIIASTSYHFLLRAENARRDRGERDEVIGKSGDSELEERNEKNGRFDTVADAKREKGDEWSGYRYIL
ncbi:MFS general substrate transporter [Mycena leptocephala]|nr:MFS general substrate transporter [Mycena leptocephala]